MPPFLRMHSEKMPTIVPKHGQNVTVLRINIIFCDICCFSSASLLALSASPIFYKLVKLSGIFSLRMRETGVYLLTVKNMTSPSFPATPVCCIGENVRDLWPFTAFFNCACAETGIFLLPVKNMTSPSFPATPVTCIGGNFRDFWPFRAFF